MAFFNDLSKKITQTSQDVVKKTKDSSEIFKLEGIITEQGKKINSIYQQLGKLYYEIHRDSYEPPFEDMIVQINDCEKRKLQCLEQIDKIKGVKKCTQCGAKISYTSNFCNSCGLEFEIENTDTHQKKETNVITCKNCNSVIGEDSAFCENCGAQMNSDGNALTGSFEAVQDNTNKCNNCGQEVGDAAFCHNCGAKV